MVIPVDENARSLDTDDAITAMLGIENLPTNRSLSGIFWRTALVMLSPIMVYYGIF
jgi:hypothetical protein